MFSRSSFVVLGAIALVGVFVACGSNNDDASPATPDSTSTTTPPPPPPPLTPDAAPQDAGSDAHDAAGPDPVIQIAARNFWMCARRQSGKVLCWGLNEHGQLGDGSTTNRSLPTPVSGLVDAKDITVSGDQQTAWSCAVKADGTVVCWGDNSLGQLGDGTTTPSHVPVAVKGLTNAVQVSAGWDHTCALKSDGTVACWGNNEYGQLGNNTNTPVAAGTLASVVVLDDAVEIAATNYCTCTRRKDGTVFCWGLDSLGAFGHGVVDGGLSGGIAYLGPVAMLGVTDAVQISTGVDNCVLRATGEVLCAGYNYYGTIGDGTNDTRTLATPVSGLTDAMYISAASPSTSSAACAIKKPDGGQAGPVVCWGGTGDWGAIGDGTGKQRNAPVPIVGGITDAISTVSGADFSCALRSNGAIVCWGGNIYGELGRGTLSGVMNLPGGVTLPP
jgi:alpha-tubulin suppressor-like RCC1 family protein